MSEYREVLKPNLVSAMAGQAVLTMIISVIIAAPVGYFLSVTAAVLVFPISIIALNALSYFNIKSREYRFNNDQIEVYEGFLNISQNNVAYNRITDISLQKPVTQRIFGTGTILINTAGSDFREVSIGHVDSPDETYENVKQITGQN